MTASEDILRAVDWLITASAFAEDGSVNDALDILEGQAREWLGKARAALEAAKEQNGG